MTRMFWGLFPVERAAALMYYEPHAELAQIVYRMKYNNRPDIGEDLGRVMAVEMQYGRFFDGIDLLIPVPLSPKRLRQRGYNQSTQLAMGIRQLTGIPLADGILKRKHFHKSQTQLSRQERQENVSDIFYVKHPERLEGKHILLIDDICTTGATLTACANQMKEIPGIKISILTLGITSK